MHVCEIFHSIQGESTQAGLPCIFIRLSGCNLRCRYCDTAYAWEGGEELANSQILQRISQYPTKLVEITGGEPLCQPDVFILLEELDKAGYTVLLETNGSLSVQKVPSQVRIIMDYKLPGSGQPDSFLIENLQYLKSGWDELKFVITNHNDFDYALHAIDQYKLHGHTLLFSPVQGKLKPAVLSEWIVASGYPLRLNLQLHKYIWKDKQRGV